MWTDLFINKRTNGVPTGLRQAEATGLRGLYGQPYINLSDLINTTPLDEIYEEVCLGLSQIKYGMTGGNHLSFNLLPPQDMAGYRDYQNIIAGFSDEEFARFASLGKNFQRAKVEGNGVPSAAPLVARHQYGEGSTNPFSEEQMKYLMFRYQVYFPWQVAFTFFDEFSFLNKHSGQGKKFLPQVDQYFPKTKDYIFTKLPFAQIGRVVIFGLLHNHHANVHRDQDPATYDRLDEFITICPKEDKRLFIWDPLNDKKFYATGKLYWFNDLDFHGVEAGPEFRWSIRVDGQFTDKFRHQLKDKFHAN